MTAVPAWTLRHRITIEPYLGDTAYGPQYGPPLPDVPALVAFNIRTVRTREGREATSTAQIIAGPNLECPADSRITLPDGRTTRALTVARHTAPGLPVPASTEVSCE
ncbi:hypothetical protein OOK39_21800 [Streptomyces sp. NBC_00264]|uniref:hypothetical protein n=1 Tax=unclassified Streptomyces TaxID=2593676 RepID=UPI002259BE79|nr:MULTISPECIES: hypothetical protein [unclassified Streptomyces]MCX5161873.1 hypothetical protein [Streptomyces sp. NBC_00305]MCX5220396.1 hypothetical protein [Streptomyces sp. NBC_00264]